MTRSRAPHLSAQQWEKLRLKPHPLRKNADGVQGHIFNIKVKHALQDESLKHAAAKAIDKELTQMLSLCVFAPVNAGEEASLRKPIRSSMFLK